jgi:thiol:disulfide interchange protein DsbD
MRKKGQLKQWLLLLLLFVTHGAMAQLENPAEFKTSFRVVSDKEAEISFVGKIESGWHIYSTGLPEDGPTSASFNVDKISGLSPKGKLQTRGKEIEAYDDMFGMKLRYFEHEVTFVQSFTITQKEYSIKGYLEYGACSEQACMPPTAVNFNFHGEAAGAATEAPEATAAVEETATVEDTVTQDNALVNSTEVSSELVDTGDWWRPVTEQLTALSGGASQTIDKGLWAIFLLGFLGGLVALFTPCVWPIIPMTVSFFLKRNKDRRSKGVREAWLYGASIVVIYVTMGLLVTLIFGANALNMLSTNAYFNLFFCLMLVVFAAGFFGWFELTLPSSWSNAVDRKAEATTGLLSIFLMAFTLTLVSFSCTGPIIGFLLVEVATTGSIIAPTVGMAGFAIALALPFTLFALFPAMLKRAPRSGGWMNDLKVCLGFLELAFALKFFSVADLAYGWHLMDREVFLCIWIVLFALLGAYLMGWFRFAHGEEEMMEDPEAAAPSATPVPKFFLAMASFAFAIYMIPGLWGAPCKAISAFAPPMNTQDFNLYNREVKPLYLDYDAGMAYAKQQDKPVMIDFSGHGCVNCRKMESAVWSDATVATKLTDDYVLITLFVDDKTPLPEPITIRENGGETILRTIGDKWSYLQRSKFGANAQPFYVLLDNSGLPLAAPYSYDEDVQKYIDFLDSGLKEYKK